jgi:outer membrane protein assembly factor BamB
VTADRVVEDAFSYRLTNATLRGFDRSNGRLRWSVPLSDSQAPSVSAAASKGVLGLIDRLRITHGDGNYELLVLNPESGEILFRRKGEFRDLAAREGSLDVLEGTGPGDGQLYICDLPACVKNPGLGLSAKEILSFQLYRDFVLTWGLYDAACFSRSTGERLWEKGQIEWTLPFENEMIAADYSLKGNAARIISIDLRTGAERVLFSRGLTEKDRKAFIPLSQ